MEREVVNYDFRDGVDGAEEEAVISCYYDADRKVK